jgi:hypothetical protein
LYGFLFFPSSTLIKFCCPLLHTVAMCQITTSSPKRQHQFLPHLTCPQTSTNDWSTSGYK